MFLGCLLIGTVLIGFGIYLDRNESQGWHQNNDEDSATLDQNQQSELDREYFAGRRRSRRRIHWMIIGSGVLITIAAFFGTGVVWLAAWMIVTMALAVIVLLAGLDAVRTIRYQKAKQSSLERDFESE